MAKTRSGWRIFGHEQPRQEAEWCIYASVHDQGAYLNSHWSHIPRHCLNVARCADVPDNEILETFLTEKDANKAIKQAE